MRCYTHLRRIAGIDDGLKSVIRRNPPVLCGWAIHRASAQSCIEQQGWAHTPGNRTSYVGLSTRDPSRSANPSSAEFLNVVVIAPGGGHSLQLSVEVHAGFA